MAEVKTVQIKSNDDNDGFIVINESDFDEDTMELLSPSKKKKQKEDSTRTKIQIEEE